jgi:DNA-binding NtrC family response regulator
LSAAARDRDGGVTRAGAGTLFIDEIDKLSLACQAGLLRLLEDHSFRVLGDDRQDRRCPARIIVGTNVDLEAAVARGEFREDPSGPATCASSTTSCVVPGRCASPSNPRPR